VFVSLLLGYFFKPLVVECFLEGDSFVRVDLEQTLDEVFGLVTDGLPNASVQVVLSSRRLQQRILDVLAHECHLPTQPIYTPTYRK